jgi:predicted Zn finger-like uncharacterized protein
MPEIITCPQCNRQLRVPDDLLGQEVKCPSCGATFRGGAAASEPPAVTPVREREPEPAAAAPRRRPAPPEDDYGDDYGDERRRRRYLQPHRASTILVLGILALLPIGLGFILGPIAWVMGNNDLREMRAGRMDPEGESTTNAGRICGIIATILTLISLVCCGGSLLLFGIGAAGRH